MVVKLPYSNKRETKNDPLKSVEEETSGREVKWFRV